MKIKKTSGIFILSILIFLFAIIPPAKAKAAEQISLNQTVTIGAGSSGDYEIYLQPGIIYVESSIRYARHVASGQYDYTEPCDAVSAWISQFDVDSVEEIDDDVYYVKKATKASVYMKADSKDSDEVTEPGGGTITIKNGAQYLKASQAKSNNVGNNVYIYTPSASGTYAFTCKANGNIVGNGTVEIYTLKDSGLEELEKSANTTYYYTEGYNFGTQTATLKAGVTYYIVANGYNSVKYGSDSYYELDQGYTLSISQSPLVSVPTVKISKVTSPKTKKITVTWKKAKKVNGYEISYSTDKSMRTVSTVSASKKAASKTIKKLLKKKIYYIRIRAYKTVKGNKYYGNYSKKLKVKTK